MDKKSRDLVMGKLFLKNKDYKMAEKSFSEYLSTNPEDYQALKMLAQVQEHLNDTAKAFDLYQRCYLAQPDRKGVLLDICRLLLIRDARLDHVDQRKWLKLAAQSFPTNPIVTNLRESLPNSQDSHPGRITTEDLILEKLTSLEDRFRNFEDRIKSIEDKLTDLSLKPPNPQAIVSELKPTPTLNHTSVSLETETSPKIIQACVPDYKPDITNTPIPKPVEQIFKPSTSETPVKPPEPVTKHVTPEAPAKNIFSTPFSSSVFSSPNKTSTADTAPQLNFNSLSLNSGPPKPPQSELIPKLGLNTTLPNSTPTKSVAPTEPTKVFGEFGTLPKFDSKPAGPTEGGFNFTGFTGVNLFAESMKKNNLPSESLWTSAKPATSKPDKEEGKEGEYDADDNDSEVVNNEELPIENFCDMKPIEIKSGEEDEDIVFEFRCKLFRFRDKEYKERGLGNIKVLKHRETGKGRLIMRREQINLVCLNCWSCTKIERVRDTQVRFAGLDASDGDPISTIFLAKFGTQDKTDEFMKHLTDLFTED